MNPSSVTKYTETAAVGITLGTIALFPLFMLPTTANYFETNKLLLMILATGLLLITWAVRTALSKTVSFRLNAVTVPFLAYGLVHFISAFVSTPLSPVNALMDRASFIPALALFMVAAANLIESRKFIRQAIYTLIGSSTILAIITIFQSFGFGLSNLLNKFLGLGLPNTLAFTPAGSPLALIAFLGPVMLLSLMLAFTKKDATEKVSLFILTALMAAAFVVTSVYAFPGKDTAPVFLPLRAGYAIAIETLKLPKTAIFGVGTDSFVVAYNQFRPGFMNTSEFWNVRFSVSTNEVLHLLTTVGVLGLGIFAWMVGSFIKSSKRSLTGTQSQALKVTTFAVLFLFLLLPATYLMLFSMTVFFLLWGLQLQLGGHDKTYSLALDENAAHPQSLKKIGIFAPAVLITAVAVASLYFAGRAYAAELTFKRAIDAANKNDGIKTYDLQRQAILQNPFLTSYRRSYAATNLALANAIAGNKELNDSDKQNIAQLIQQAIREAKVAVSLEPQNAANWENLSYIYQSLINAAQGADQWTVAAVSQAIQTDPTNPQLRVTLGGVYYSLNAYDQAIRLFQQATELKPDYANAYYNLAHAYLQKKDAVAAYDYMQQVLQLVKPDSADYTKAKEELTELAKQLPKQDQTQAQQEVQKTAPAKTSLQTPAPATSSARQQVNLPAGSGPDNLNGSATTPTGDVQP